MFINNSLQFSVQKYAFINSIESEIGRYGKKFVFEYTSSCPGIKLGNTWMLSEVKDFLFAHILIALEVLGYFKIENIWIFDMDSPPEKQTKSYKIKIDLKKKFFNEREAILSDKPILNSNEKREKQRNNLVFNEDKSVLFFNKKEITISKARDSNGHYLLKTIFKDKNKIWEFDEIAEDWGDVYGKNDWNRYYNAGYKVNEKVAKETTIKDFLKITSKTVSINKEYL